VWKTHRMAWATIVLLVAGSARAATPQELASQVKTVFKVNCYRCHGDRGAAEGGMAYITDLAKLVERKKVVPGNPGGSKLYKKIASEDDPMPPLTDDDNKPITQRPSKEQIALVRQWIEAGAPSDVPAIAVAARPFISNDDIFSAIQTDLAAANERSRVYLRYFTITHLYNAGLNDDELQTYRGGLSKLVNSLSWGRRVVVPVAIDPQKTIFRIDLRDYQWNEATWKKILDVYPYRIGRETAAARESIEQTQSGFPYVRADWFVFAASRPPLYHDVLALPASDAELEKLLKVDAAEDIRTERIARAGFNGSGVSRNNRLIERHDSPYGAYWKSYDFKQPGNNSRKDLFVSPLGPGDHLDNFEQDGGEIIFNLPNGLQAYMLVNAKGERIDKGPAEIVSDPKQLDRAVVNGVSCMSCHARGMIEKTDQVRATVLGNAAGYDVATVETVKALYPPKAAFDELLKDDADRFVAAVEKTGVSQTHTEPVFSLALRFQVNLDEPLAAAEAGLSTVELREAIAGSTVLAPELGALGIPGGTVQRDVYVTAFPDLVERAEKLKFAHRPYVPDPAAVTALQRRVDAGDPGAMYDMAIRLQVANGVPMDLGKAWDLLTKSAEKGYAPAMLRLANINIGTTHVLFRASKDSEVPLLYLGIQTDLEEAVKWYNRAVDAGSPMAMFAMAKNYDDGFGVPKDATRASDLYARAASVASAAPPTDGSAAFCLYMLAVEKKITLDDARAKALLQTAIDHNESDALVMASFGARLGDRPKDMQYILETQQRAALAGSVLSDTLMGLALEDVDTAQAQAWLQRAIDGGEIGAMRELSAMYRTGRGVAKDDRRATELTHQAVNGGDYRAMMELAQDYYDGLGVPVDPDTARAWMHKALLLEKGDTPGPAGQWLKDHGENP
jgi:TPR repeat protein/mono/diheme cytochrome c family protein